ncbi:MAG: nucleoside monophosphate kinase [Candidatus Doudnabacteria bacterium]|nr:nucleoside monophosphate kinase [Candidatus Doudnabacteria bacterium]
MNLNAIFFIGPQGSGKGTQAKILAKKLGFFYWEMGGILRAVAKDKTDLGHQVKNMIDNGILLPDETLFQVLESRLLQIGKNQGVIFDGLPRRVGQAEFLMGFLQKRGRQNFTTLFIDIPKEESLKRLLGRAKGEGRADDTREVIEKRLEQYYESTLPVVEYLKKKTHFIEIDGRPPIDEITKKIDSALKLK